MVLAALITMLFYSVPSYSSGIITHIGQAQDIINKIHEAKEKGEAPPIPVLYFDCLTPDVFLLPES